MNILHKRFQYAVAAALLILVALGLRTIWASLPFWLRLGKPHPFGQKMGAGANTGVLSNGYTAF